MAAAALVAAALSVPDWDCTSYLDVGGITDVVASKNEWKGSYIVVAYPPQRSSTFSRRTGRFVKGAVAFAVIFAMFVFARQLLDRAAPVMHGSEEGVSENPTSAETKEVAGDPGGKMPREEKRSKRKGVPFLFGESYTKVRRKNVRRKRVAISPCLRRPRGVSVESEKIVLFLYGSTAATK